MVTHRPDENVANVVSFVEGHPLKEGSEVSLDVGGAKFDLFTKGDSAWAPTAELDKAIVEAMTKGKQAILKGTPRRKGRPTTDTLTSLARLCSQSAPDDDRQGSAASSDSHSAGRTIEIASLRSQ